MRVTTRWDGFSGAPGYTVMHFRDFDTESTITPEQALAAINRVVIFFEAVSAYIPNAATLTVQREVEVIEDTTGELVGATTYTGTLGAIGGDLAGGVAGPAGAVVNWRTGSIRNGRRIRGRTFLVPLATGAYESNGSLLPTVVQTIQDAATALATSTGNPDLGVYARPTAPGAADGQWAVVTSATVPDMVAVLRSRRD